MKTFHRTLMEMSANSRKGSGITGGIDIIDSVKLACYTKLNQLYNIDSEGKDKLIEKVMKLSIIEMR